MSTTTSSGASPQNPADVPVKVASSNLDTPQGQQHPSQGTCANCRRRKVKCDKLSPCSNCIRTRTQCDLAPRKRAPRRPRNKQSVGEHSGERETKLLERLNKLEGLVKELSGQEGDSSRTDSTAPSTTFVSDFRERSPRSGSDTNVPDISGSVSRPHESITESRLGEDFGTLVVGDGKSRYVNHLFWARLSEEVHDIRNMVIDEVLDNEASPSVETTSSDTDQHLSFIFGYSSSNVDLRHLHPLPSQMPYYFQIFKERVDPIIKLLHMPTMEKVVKQIQERPDSMSRSREALMFAMYFAVVTSMSSNEVKLNLGLEKKLVIDRYSFGVEQALARADFLNSAELVTLQSFVLYLACVQCHEQARVGWALTRSAIGIAESLGLHRDGTIFGLPPYECEMRRRLWWQLCILDFRNAEKQGTDITIFAKAFETKRPLNINDVDLTTDAVVPPQERDGFTEMTLTHMAGDVCCTITALQQSRPGFTPSNTTPKADTSPSMSFAEKETIIHGFKKQFEETYLQYCGDAADPVAYLAAAIGELTFAKMALISYMPLKRSGAQIPKDISDRAFLASIKVVQDRRNMETERTKAWHWFIRTFEQWHAITFLLLEVCEREPDENMTHAWAVLDQVFQDWRDSHKMRTPGMLAVSMRKLIARARRKREVDLAAARKGEEPKIHVTHEHFPGHQPSSGDDDHHLPQSTLSGVDLVQSAPPQQSDQDSTLYPKEWQREPQQFANDAAPIPWLLEESALDDLGLDMSVLDGEMEWEGLDDLIQGFQAEVPQKDAPFSGWSDTW